MLNKVCQWVVGFPPRKNLGLNSKLNLLMSIDGYLSRNEAMQLMELAANSSPNSVIVEIGSYRGRSTIALAFGSLSGPQNRIYSIDPFIDFKGVLGGEFGPKDQAKFYKNILFARVGEIVSLIALSSSAASRGWIKTNICLLWIDGDHAYESVIEDFWAWKPFLIENAVVVFHDINTSGVQGAINERIENGEIIRMGEIDIMAWFELAKK